MDVSDDLLLFSLITPRLAGSQITPLRGYLLRPLVAGL